MSDTLAAVLWDMDGTLIDSEPIWIAQQFVLAEQHGATWSTEQGLALVGADMHDTALAMQAVGVDLDSTELVATLERAVIDSLRETVPWRPGVRELLAALRQQGIPCAIATTSSHEMADLVASAAPDGAFSVVVGSEDVTRTKPSPEPYLRAARAARRTHRAVRGGRGLAQRARVGDRVGCRDARSRRTTCGASAGAFTTWPTLAGRTVADPCSAPRR